ncbi:XAP5, circadian clock regulator-domain-containing protein [Endogone sp. FLAS-F59071]|nr:XAP5, circadian clock regulator-domain-containing protein [Endogone sp. FLAS-F59071]RUS18356.1 XAP5, circadian clock regulator-domain-containing protein [Endogone sp. FLAS-F59071]|eukprot:RUS17432.1 XAP5, circadian clock regulator-domain-containing protein [Endogone sp. FLAS-F59071]
MEYKGASSEGQRQTMLEKKRKEMLENFERQKKQIAKVSQWPLSFSGRFSPFSEVKVGSDKFVSHTGDIDSQLMQSTIGLVELQDFRKIRDELEEQKRREAAKTSSLGEEKVKKKKKKDKTKIKLSFAGDDEEEETKETKETKENKESESADDNNDEQPAKKKSKLGKDPGVDTSFLPDREREEAERKEREQLRQEWLKKQEELKNEAISVTYSFWDGSGHRKQVKCKKGDTIAQFLEKCRQQFHQLRSVNVDNLIYVKEDLIIPHHYTFYDFIINKARGKSGPLFNFDVHDDIRLTHDASVEKDESHAGKVVERGWYEKNKHIFPASRWEVFDPEKQYGKYTIKDTNKDNKE